MAKREPSRAGQYWEKRLVKSGCGCIRVLRSFVAATSDGQSSADFDAWHELRVVIQDLLPPSPGRVNRVFGPEFASRCLVNSLSHRKTV